MDRMTSFGVYKYMEEKTRVATIGKFFKLDDPRPEKISRIKGEYENLQKIRAYGFDRYPNYVVRPIGSESSGSFRNLLFLDNLKFDIYI